MNIRPAILLLVFVLAACHAGPPPSAEDLPISSQGVAPTELIPTMIDSSLSERTLGQASPTLTRPLPLNTIMPVPGITSTPTALPIQVKEPVILYRSLPGDGGGCMADYLGWSAPGFVLYSDGMLLKHNPHEDPWYSQAQLSQHELANFLGRIEQAGFFSIAGDGTLYEEDPIYQFPANYDHSLGAGSISFKARLGELTKQVTIYALWLDYLVPEINNALELVWDYQLTDAVPYQPANWVVWVEDLDPCEPYQLEYQPWPEGAPDVAALLGGASRGQLLFQSTARKNLIQMIGDKPGTYIYQNGEVSYFILTRPLLPHELPSVFLNY